MFSVFCRPTHIPWTSSYKKLSCPRVRCFVSLNNKSHKVTQDQCIILLQLCPYLVPFLRYLALNNGVTLKSGFGVVRHWRRSIDHVTLYWLAIERSSSCSGQGRSMAGPDRSLRSFLYWRRSVCGMFWEISFSSREFEFLELDQVLTCVVSSVITINILITLSVGA